MPLATNCLRLTAEERLHLRKSVPVRLEHGWTGQAADSCTAASVSVVIATFTSSSLAPCIVSACTQTLPHVGLQMHTRLLRLTGCQK